MWRSDALHRARARCGASITQTIGTRDSAHHDVATIVRDDRDDLWQIAGTRCEHGRSQQAERRWRGCKACSRTVHIGAETLFGLGHVRIAVPQNQSWLSHSQGSARLFAPQQHTVRGSRTRWLGAEISHSSACPPGRAACAEVPVGRPLTCVAM
eukprot:COSAG02_NODE_2048_length_10009_cov_34.602321_6_plen_154_part_00